MRLPGMEVLGFYDEPYQVAVERPAPPRRTAAIVTAGHRPGPPASDAGALVSSLWETTQVEESALEWWKPQVVARRKLGGRRVRPSTVAWLLMGVVGLLFLTWSVLQRPERLAAESQQLVGSDTRAFLQTLGPVEEMVAGMGQSDAPDLTGSTEQILEAESAARRLFEDSGALTGNLRDVAAAAAGSVLEVTNRANRLLAYRMAAERTLIVPDLPTSPEGTDLPATTEAVAAWRAETDTALGELAEDVLPDHRSRVEEWLRTLDAWQGTYLDALRREDGDTMSSSVEALEGEVRSLHEALLDELAEESGELRGVIADARQAAERLLD